MYWKAQQIHMSKLKWITLETLKKITLFFTLLHVSFFYKSTLHLRESLIVRERRVINAIICTVFSRFHPRLFVAVLVICIHVFLPTKRMSRSNEAQLSYFQKAKLNTSTVICSQFSLDQRIHKQGDDADANCTHDHPEDNEPRRGVRGDRCCQSGIDAIELQSLIC